MKWQRPVQTLFAASLALGFLSGSPFDTERSRQLASCLDPTQAQEPSQFLTLPAGFVFGVQDFAAQQSDQIYALFVQQMQLVAQANEAAMRTHYGMQPLSLYSMPTASSVDYSKPDSSQQIFGGLSTNPSFRHLVTYGQPSVPTPSVPASSVASVGAQSTVLISIGSSQK